MGSSGPSPSRVTVFVPKEFDVNEWRQSMSQVTFGLALVMVMAAALLALVAVNPKHEEYGATPWAYAAGSLTLAAACWLASTRLDRPAEQE